MVVISGLTATPQVISVNTMNTLGGGGVATVIIHDFEQATKTTYKSDIGKTITFTEERSGNSLVVFKGELMLVQQIGEHKLKLTIDSGARKLFKQPTNHNQILGSGTVKYIHDDIIEDIQVAPFDINWDNTGSEKALVIKKNGLRNTKIYPDHFTTTGSPTETGDLNTLCFNNENYTGSLGNGNEVSFKESTDNTVNLVFYYYLWKKVGTNITGIKLNNLLTMYEDASGEIDFSAVLVAQLRIYHYGFASYFGIAKEYGESEDGWSTTQLDNPPVKTNIDFINLADPDFTQYINAIGGANASAFQKYELKIRISFPGPDYVGANTERVVRIFAQSLDFTFDGDQAPALSQGYIKTASTTTGLIELDNTKSWSLDDFPIADGFSAGDTWNVCDWLDNMIANIFTDSPTTFTLDENITGLGDLVDISGIYNKFVGDVLNKYTNPLNSIWWYEPSDDKIYLRSLDNVSRVQYGGGPSNTKIIKTSVIGGDAGVQHTIDGRGMRDYLRIIGAYEVQDSDDLSPEFTLTQGDTYGVEIDNSIVTSYLMTQALANRQYKYTKVKEDIRLSVDLSKEAIWPQLAIGKWINIQMGAAGLGKIVNFVHNATEAVLVYALGLRNDASTGFIDIIDLILQRRSFS